VSVGTEIKETEKILSQGVPRELIQVSVVIPVYNSEATLVELVGCLLTVLGDLELGFEIIMVDDGSEDKSWDILCELQARYASHVVAIQLMRNYGQHNALMCGFRQSRGEYIVTLDDDLQNPPEEIPKLLSVIRENETDLVYGIPEVKKHDLWRNLGSILIRKFYKRVFKLNVQHCSFRVIRRNLMESILSYNLNFTYIDGLLAWNTRRVGSVFVDHHARPMGRSGYSLRKLLILSFNLFTNFSLLPLQFVSACGVLVALVGMGAGFFYFFQSLHSNIAVPGYASTIIAIMVLGGTQLLALGIMGEYLGRLHLNVNRKPQYVSRQVLGPKVAPAQDWWKSEGAFASKSLGSRHLP